MCLASIELYCNKNITIRMLAPDDQDGRKMLKAAMLKTAERTGVRLDTPPELPTPVLATISQSLTRIADALDPPPPDVVDTPYVAKRLACTTTWVADMVRQGAIPKHCLVPGTGNGKPWKFYRSRIDAWIESR